MGRWVGRITALLACVVASAGAAPQASAADVYSYANGCYALRDVTTNRYVVRDSLGYSTGAATVGAATPFRMQATALGRYLLYLPDRTFLTAQDDASVSPASEPSPAADWTVKRVGRGDRQR